MTTPERGLLFHFTHMANLKSIVRNGLSCDAHAHDGQLQVEVGNQDIKERRRSRMVPVPPGGVVADYVPFYFAARSPMLYVIWRGQVPTYQAGQEDVVYLVTTIERVAASGIPSVFTDRNATLGYAEFSDDLEEIDSVIDWDLMEAMIWKDQPGDWDRKERRMAEFLVHQRLPWEHVVGIGVLDDVRRARVEAILASLDERTPVRTRRNWYY